MATPARLLCIRLDNSGYQTSLKRRQIHVANPDPKAGMLGQLRIVDESGDDYLYPAKRFVAADLPQAIRKAVMQAA
jgi:hypothetical protein